MPATTTRGTGGYATLDDERAVIRSSFPRKIQHRNETFQTTLPKTMVKFLNLGRQGAEIDPRLIKGTEPVLIDEPAIVIPINNEGER